MLLHSGWFLLLLSILVFWSLGAYNRLVRLRAQVGQQFGALESVLMNYQELVHQAVTAAATAPQLWATSTAPDLGADQWTRLQVAVDAIACGPWPPCSIQLQLANGSIGRLPNQVQ